MFKQTFETSATPHITITECLGNLTVRGSEDRRFALRVQSNDAPPPPPPPPPPAPPSAPPAPSALTLRVQGSDDDVVLEQVGETFTLSTRANCLLTCPPATTLSIGAVMGNLQVDGVAGPVAASAIHGNVQLRNVGPTAVEETFGNLRAHYVDGDLSAQITRGKVRVGQIEGSLTVNLVDGNLTVEGLQGGLITEQVRGNIRLESLFAPGQTYRLNAHGNLTIYVPPDAGLNLTLQAGGGVRSNIPNLTLEETDGTLKGTLGDGAAILEAKVSGRISLRPAESYEVIEEGTFDFVADLEGLGTQIESRITEAMAEMEVRLDESLGRIDSEQIRIQMEQAKEHAFRKTEHAAQKARQVAEREAERARMRAERAERRWQRASGKKSRPKREPATDEERMRVLRMVEEGRITPEQAAELLAALEGR